MSAVRESVQLILPGMCVCLWQVLVFDSLTVAWLHKQLHKVSYVQTVKTHILRNNQAASELNLESCYFSS